MKLHSIVVVFSVTLAIGSALVAVVSGFGYRFQFWGYLPGFKMLIAGAVAAAVGAVVALVGIYLSWRSGRLVQLSWSAAALVVGLAVLAPVVLSARTLRAVPRIHDISTDTDNPPAFVAILRERASAPNTAEYAGPEVVKLQHVAYPDLKPLRLPVPSTKAFDAALDTTRNLGWKIVDADPIAGRIEASDQTFWYGFIDDIVIRVASDAGGARVDVRSVSRVGQSDLGANARRIRQFFDSLSKKLIGSS